MSLKLNGATNGSIQLDVPAAIGSDLNVTLPATAGEVAVKATDGSVDLGDVNIDSSGRLLVGTSTSQGINSGLQVVSDTGATIHRGNATAGNAPQLRFTRSRNTTYGSFTSVANGDELGKIAFAADDGTDYSTQAATITAFVDNTPGANDMPGRLVFSTTADGASSPTERLRIASDGRFTTNGVTQIFDRGSTNGNSSFTRDFTLNYPDTAIITCAFSHYGLFTYGCSRITFVGFGPAFSPNTVHNHTTGNSGSWDISRVANDTIRVTKNAGSNGGSGLFFIHVLGT